EPHTGMVGTRPGGSLLGRTDNGEPLLANQESLLHDDDIEDVGEALEPGSSVAMILFEHAWANEFRRALVGAVGELIDSLRIAPETIEAARVALTEGED
ncbi:MAG: hypothetical protein V3U46_06115, partial [Acidimicrobiia bacterium]